MRPVTISSASRSRQFVALAVVALIAAAVWLVARSVGDRRPSRAREILDERYARGELTTDEYHERLDALR